MRLPPFEATLVLSLLLATRANAASVGGSIGAASDYVLRGVSQNHAEPALQGDLHLRFARDWSAGLWASQVQLLPHQHSAELDTYLQWHRALSTDFDLALTATHYAYPNDPRPINYDYDEAGVSLAWRDQLYATVSYTPAVTLFTTHGYIVERDRRVTSYELAAHRSLSAHLDVLAGIGFYEPRGLDYASYTYGSTSLAWHYGKWRADLAWIAVQGANHRWYTQGEAGGPVTLSVAWAF
jgi:uncharacterized protein (TIGR02001 family)